ncbi:MAG: hypothetical protein SGILL_009026 [Bacillariaceae sp.]
MLSFSDPDFNAASGDGDDSDASFRAQLDVFEDESTDDGAASGSVFSALSIPSSAAAFLANHKTHPIHSVLENRSWNDDDNDDNATHSSASKTDDDEFRMELERLNLSEREVSQEIKRAMQAFQYTTVNSSTARKSASVSSGKALLAGGVGAKEDLAVSSIDSRNSPTPSCPSDEGSGGQGSRSTVYEDQREQPSPVLSPRTPRASNANPEQHYFSDSTTTSSGMQQVYDDPSADLMTLDEHGSLKPDLTNTTPYETLEDEQDVSSQPSSHAKEDIERHVATSPWEDKTEVDLESGNRDLFEEESFWDDGLWKTPENSRHERTGEWSESEYTEEEGSIRRPNTKDLEQLFIPSLKPPPTDTIDEEMEEESQPLQSMSESESERDTMSAFQDEIEPAYWDINKEPHEILEDQLDSQHTRTAFQQQTMEQETATTKRQSKEEPESSDEEEKEMGSCCDGWCTWWRLILIAVHAIFFVAGIIVLVKFLKTRRSNEESKYPAPSNDVCSLANNDFLVDDTSTIVAGTTLGATANAVPCLKEPVNGVWYNAIGTGEEMVASANSQSDFQPQITILSGSCESLQCEEMYDDATDSSGSSSVLWFSEAETTYRILVHGQPAGNFSLGLTDATESDEWLDPAGRIPIQYQTETLSKSRTWIIVGVVTGSTCILFALIAWRWRKLKGSKAAEQ